MISQAVWLTSGQEFGIEHDPWLVGVINSAPALFGLATAWAADPVNNWLGRRGAIFLTGLFCIFPVLAQGFAQNWWGLLICRMFMGFGMGIKISTIPVYSAEISPASIRGGMVTSFQLWVAFGIFIGQCSNLIFYRIGRLAWRFQLAAAFAPAIPIVILVWWCPESPRWLLKKNRYHEAYTALCRIRNSEVIAARELYYAHCQIAEEHEAFAGVSLGRRMLDLFTVPRLRRATVASSVIVISQQFSGINIVAFYSSTIFAEAGYGIKECLLVSMGFGLITFVFAFPAVYTMDTFGRRNLLLVTFPNMTWCLLGAGFCFLIPESSPARVPLIALFVFLFAALYGPGQSPLHQHPTLLLAVRCTERNFGLPSHRHGPPPLHLLQRSVPALAPRNRRRIHNLRQQRRRVRPSPHLPLFARQSDADGRLCLLRGAQRVRLLPHLFPGSRDHVSRVPFLSFASSPRLGAHARLCVLIAFVPYVCKKCIR